MNNLTKVAPLPFQGDHVNPVNASGFDDMENDEPLGYINKPVAAPVVLYKEPCKKCRGSGRWSSYTGSTSGSCFDCGGKGFHEFKTSPEYRTEQRAKAANKKVKDLEAKKAKWILDNKAVYDWLLSKDGSFDFATSLLAGFNQYGSLTPGQLAAAQRLLDGEPAREAARQAARAAQDARKEEINIAKIEESFKKANQRLKWPTLRLDGFNFSLAGSNSRNPGAIYVKQDGGTYLGKVLGGLFSPVRECTPDLQAAVVAACEDPEGAAVRYGRLTGRCAICNRKLVDPESVNRGIGPICAENYGW